MAFLRMVSRSPVAVAIPLAHAPIRNLLPCSPLHIAGNLSMTAVTTAQEPLVPLRAVPQSDESMNALSDLAKKSEGSCA
jgi:hypothetical protein